jgi:hypothetical protein
MNKFRGLDNFPVKDVSLESWGCGLEMALNPPELIRQATVDRYAWLTGWKGWQCDYCPKYFLVLEEAIQHESEH